MRDSSGFRVLLPPRLTRALIPFSVGAWVFGATCAHALNIFSEVAVESGIPFKHETPAGPRFGSGAAWIDFDRDGDVDLYITQRVGANRLYENVGGGKFVEISGALGADDPSHDGSGVSVADFNNDGWPDLYLANGDEDVLLKNINGTSFVDVTTSANLSGQGASTGQTPSWGDFNQDGFLDLYVSNHLPRGAESPQDRLFVNNGDETFSDVSDVLGLENLKGFAFIAGWTDFDDDGDLDIFLVNDCPFGPTVMRFFRNDGGVDAADWQFKEISTELGIAYCAAGMGIAVGDLDRDGSVDYFHTNIGRPNLLQNTFGIVTDKTADSGILPRAAEIESGTSRWTWGCNLLDYDNDGWLDLYIAAGTLEGENDRQENLLYRNLGTGFTFEDVTDISGAADTLRSRTSIVADYDGDGDLDIFVVNYGDSARLYRNDTNNGHHFLKVGLQGTVSNRDGIGARVRITAADGQQYAETRSGSSLGGGDSMKLHFGLGAAAIVDELHVRWPSGIEQALYDIDVDTFVVVTEPTTPLQLSIGVLQNPYLTQFLDIIIIASNELDGEHIDLTSQLVPVEVVVLDSEEHVWKGDYEIDGDGIVRIDVCATSTTGQFGCTSTAVAAKKTTAGRGAELTSADGGLRVQTDRATKDGYMIIVSERSPSETMDGERVLASYRIGWNGSHGIVEFDLSTLELPHGAAASELYIEHVGTGRLETMEGSGSVQANDRGNGVYRLVAGGPGAARPGGVRSIRLDAAFPNPFNPSTTIRFEVDVEQRVRVAIYSVTGALIKTLLDDTVLVGERRVMWNGRSRTGEEVGSGVYFVRVSNRRETVTRKVVLLR